MFRLNMSNATNVFMERRLKKKLYVVDPWACHTVRVKCPLHFTNQRGVNNKIASMLSGMAWFFNQKSTYLPKKKITTPLCPTAPWNQGSRVIPLTGVRQRSLLQHYFFTLSWRNGLALKSGFNRYIEAVFTATLKPINRHPQTYSQSFVMPLPKYKPKRQVTDTKCIWFHFGPLFSCSWLWSAHRSDKLKCITSWKAKTEFS